MHTIIGDGGARTVVRVGDVCTVCGVAGVSTDVPGGGARTFSRLGSAHKIGGSVVRAQ